MTIYEQMQYESNMLAEQINSLQKQLKNFPDGTLLCTQNGKYTKWYISNHAHPIYLSKRDRQTAELLAVKKYYSLLLRELLLKKEAADRYLETYRQIPSNSSDLLAEDSCYKELLTPHFNSFPNGLQQWASEPYSYNTSHPEHLIHKSIAGHNVRSKSEAIIANTLFISQVPYRYECALQLESILFFPDFTIRHPKTGEIFYWEHFGLMDAPAYCEQAYNKLKIYGNHGIIPTINLITTYETHMHPIDSEKVQQLIKEYFL